MIMIIPLCRIKANTFEDKMCVMWIEKIVLAAQLRYMFFKNFESHKFIHLTNTHINIHFP